LHDSGTFIVQGQLVMTPSAFDLNPHLQRWFAWSDIQACFWPGPGRRSATVDPLLADVINMPGVYCIAWGDLDGTPNPANSHVQYIGQTKNFKARLGQFATSAGIFWEERYSGHSAAWRWPADKTEKMKVAFFPLTHNDADHLRTGRLFWYEALALDAYYLNNGNSLPPLNIPKNPEALVLA
jgi:hypothetical protein